MPDRAARPRCAAGAAYAGQGAGGTPRGRGAADAGEQGARGGAAGGGRASHVAGGPDGPAGRWDGDAHPHARGRPHAPHAQGREVQLGAPQEPGGARASGNALLPRFVAVATRCFNASLPRGWRGGGSVGGGRWRRAERGVFAPPQAEKGVLVERLKRVEMGAAPPPPPSTLSRGLARCNAHNEAMCGARHVVHSYVLTIRSAELAAERQRSQGALRELEKAKTRLARYEKVEPRSTGALPLESFALRMQFDGRSIYVV